MPLTRSLITTTSAAVLAAVPATGPARGDDPPETVHPMVVQTEAFSGADLAREGSYLLQVTGSLRKLDGGEWVFRTDDAGARQLRTELPVLPCTLLANLEQLVSSMPDEELVFELSGRVFVYHDRNYLLPTHAPRLAGYVPAPPARQPDQPAPPPDGSAQEILDQLDRAVGPVPRPTTGRTDRTGSGDSADGKLVAPGTVLLWRRGWMVREPEGAWSFVFEADADGESDPPMVLLPCLLLEEMEKHVQQHGSRPNMVVSGRVFRYHARNYLLPTAFQIARQRTPIRP